MLFTAAFFTSGKEKRKETDKIPHAQQMSLVACEVCFLCFFQSAIEVRGEAGFFLSFALLLCV